MEWFTAAMLCYLAGVAMPIGAALACIERLRPQWLEDELHHFIIAFGGGALLSAVALFLVPDGMDRLAVFPAATWLVVGAMAMMALDLYLNRHKSAAGQLGAMLTDFIPEAVALEPFSPQEATRALPLPSSSPCRICQRDSMPTES